MRTVVVMQHTLAGIFEAKSESIEDPSANVADELQNYR